MHETRAYEVEGVERTLDLFLPADAGQAPEGGWPAVVLVHGGGWQGGGPHQFHWLAARAAERGMVAACLSYRLSTEANWPVQLHDVQAGVRYVREHAEELGVDGGRVAAIGSSSGGHLAACLGVRDDPSQDVSSRVNCVVDIHGVHDFVHRQRMQPQSTSCEKLIGGTVDERPEAWRDASPIHFVDDETPPMLLTHDPGDDTVPVEESLRFAGRLLEHRRAVRFLPTPGSGHGFVYDPTKNKWSRPVGELALDWIDEHLGV